MDVYSIPNPKLGDMVRWMQRFAQRGAADPVVRKKSEEICRGVASGDYSSEILAVYHWAWSMVPRFRYMRDPDAHELVKSPRDALESMTGDCDDITVLLCALLEAAGNKCALVLAAFNGRTMPSHVLCAVSVPGGLVVVDPVANVQTGKMLREMTSWRITPVFPEAWKVSGDLPPSVPNGHSLFSTYDAHRKVYTYWSSAMAVPTVSWFRPTAGGPARGPFRVPESLAVQLPEDAQAVDEGESAQGVVAIQRGQGIGSVTTTGPAPRTPRTAVWVAGALAAGWYLGRRWS